VNIMDENSSAMVADDESRVLLRAAELLARPVPAPNPPEVQAAAAEAIREYEERRRADEEADARRSQRPMPLVNKAIDLREDELRNGRLALVRAKRARGERLTHDDRVELEADLAARLAEEIVAAAKTSTGAVSLRRLADVLCDAAARRIALADRIDTLEDRLAALEAAARPRQAERPRIRVVAGRTVA
jgi:hypothetical protein